MEYALLLGNRIGLNTVFDKVPDFGSNHPTAIRTAILVIGGLLCLRLLLLLVKRPGSK